MRIKKAAVFQSRFEVYAMPFMDSYECRTIFVRVLLMFLVIKCNLEKGPTSVVQSVFCTERASQNEGILYKKRTTNQIGIAIKSVMSRTLLIIVVSLQNSHVKPIISTTKNLLNSRFPNVAHYIPNVILCAMHKTFQL